MHVCTWACSYILESEELDFIIIVPLVYITPFTIIESLHLRMLNFLYNVFLLPEIVVFYSLIIPPYVCTYVRMYICL